MYTFLVWKFRRKVLTCSVSGIPYTFVMSAGQCAYEPDRLIENVKF